MEGIQRHRSIPGLRRWICWTRLHPCLPDGTKNSRLCLRAWTLRRLLLQGRRLRVQTKRILGDDARTSAPVSSDEQLPPQSAEGEVRDRRRSRTTFDYSVVHLCGDHRPGAAMASGVVRRSFTRGCERICTLLLAYVRRYRPMRTLQVEGMGPAECVSRGQPVLHAGAWESFAEAGRLLGDARFDYTEG